MLLSTWEIAKLLEAIVILSYPDYDPTPARTTGISFAILLMEGTWASFSWGRSPTFWRAAGALLFVTFCVLNISLLVVVRQKP